MKQRIGMLSALMALALSCPLLAQGFGSAVAVAGTDVLAAQTGPARFPGAVYVYRRAPNGAWTERAKLAASDSRAGDRFGSAIVVDGDLAAVSATAAGDSGAGAVYLLRRARTGTWSEVAKLTAATRRNDLFGRALALSGDWLAVSAPQRDSVRGTVFLFRRSGDTWSPAGTLASNEPAANERFGNSLSLANGRLVVGAPGRTSNAGAAYVFTWDAASNRWRQQSRIAVTGATPNSQLGAAIVQRDTMILVSAPGTDSGGGAVFAFRRDTTGEWVMAQQLRPFNRARNLRFGTNLSLDGNDLIVGAPNLAQGMGGLYRVRRNAAGDWADMEIVRATRPERNDFFGGSVAAAGGVTVVALTGDDNGAGSVVVMDRDARGNARQSDAFFPELPGMEAVMGGQRGCEQSRAAYFDCNAVDLSAFMPTSSIGGKRGVNLSSIWGWTDPVTNNEWALVGRADGVAFVNITNASQPVYAGELPLTEGARPSAWREIKVYRDHAYVVSDGSGNHGMQVFDLTQLRGVRGAPVRFTPTLTYRGVASVHDIVMNEETGFAYLTGSNGGGNTCGGGLHMVDVRQPENPTFAGCFQDPQTGFAHTGYTHDALCVVYRGPDERFRSKEICFGSNETALSVADVTDKARPVALAHATYPNVAYSHQAWITDDHRWLYMDDELDEISGKVNGTRTIIWDISKLDDPVVASEYISRNRASDHNLFIVGNTMYQANYLSGLRVLDITNRTAPVEIGFFDTVPYGEDVPGFDGAWSNYPFFRSGTVIVSSIGQGLFVLKPRVQRPTP